MDTLENFVDRLRKFKFFPITPVPVAPSVGPSYIDRVYAAGAPRYAKELPVSTAAGAISAGEIMARSLAASGGIWNSEGAVVEPRETLFFNNLRWAVSVIRARWAARRARVSVEPNLS